MKNKTKNKRDARKLRLKRQRIRLLSDSEKELVVGGAGGYGFTLDKMKCGK